MALNHELQNVARLVQETLLTGLLSLSALDLHDITGVLSNSIFFFELWLLHKKWTEIRKFHWKFIEIWCWSINPNESSLVLTLDTEPLTSSPGVNTSRNEWNEKSMSQGHMRHHESWHVMTQASWIWSHATDLRKRVESQKIPVVSCWHQSLGTNVASEKVWKLELDPIWTGNCVQRLKCECNESWPVLAPNTAHNLTTFSALNNLLTNYIIWRITLYKISNSFTTFRTPRSRPTPFLAARLLCVAILGVPRHVRGMGSKQIKVWMSYAFS